MRWTAIVPLKDRRHRKTRLSGQFNSCQRALLSDDLAMHVTETLARQANIDQVLMLSPCPVVFGTGWIADEGRGLNAELMAARNSLAGRNILVLHADLPLLCGSDIAALIAAAQNGVAIAPDRHGSGTNALAISADAPLNFSFGCNSLILHMASAGSKVQLVQRAGLALDIDHGGDVSLAVQGGYSLPWMRAGEDVGAGKEAGVKNINSTYVLNF